MRDFTKKYFHLNSSAVYNSSAKNRGSTGGGRKNCKTGGGRKNGKGNRNCYRHTTPTDNRPTQ